MNRRLLALVAAAPLVLLPACKPLGPAPGNDSPGSTSTPSSTSAPSNGESAVPASAELIFDGDFDTGDLSQYSSVQAEGVNDPVDSECAGGDRVCVVNAGPGHETAARFRVSPGDEAAGGERAELILPDEADVAPGDERWYSFDLNFTDFPGPEDADSGGHLIVMQWHTGSGSPLLTLNVDGEGNFTVGERWDDPAIIGPLDAGTWHHYDVRVEFSSGDDGLVEVYKNGELVATRNQATHNSDSNYVKLGIYQGESAERELMYDGVQVFAP